MNVAWSWAAVTITAADYGSTGDVHRSFGTEQYVMWLKREQATQPPCIYPEVGAFWWKFNIWSLQMKKDNMEHPFGISLRSLTHTGLQY